MLGINIFKGNGVTEKQAYIASIIYCPDSHDTDINFFPSIPK